MVRKKSLQEEITCLRRELETRRLLLLSCRERYVELASRVYREKLACVFPQGMTYVFGSTAVTGRFLIKEGSDIDLMVIVDNETFDTWCGEVYKDDDSYNGTFVPKYEKESPTRQARMLATEKVLDIRLPEGLPSLDIFLFAENFVLGKRKIPTWEAFRRSVIGGGIPL